MSLNSKTVTVGFKVPPLLKRKIKETSIRLGLDVSSYLRELFFGTHPKIARLSAYPDALIIDDHYQEEVEVRLQKLRKKYPNHSNSQLIAAALGQAVHGEKQLIPIKLKKFIK